MARAKQPRQVDRHTVFTCLSVPRNTLDGDQKEEILTTLKSNGWGVLIQENRCRFIHFDENIGIDIANTLDGLDCDQTDWCVYRLSFSNVEDTKAIVDSAEWE